MNKIPMLLDTNIVIQILNGTRELVTFTRETCLDFFFEIELFSWSKLTKIEKVPFFAIH